MDVTDFGSIWANVESGQPGRFVVHNGLLFPGKQLCIPNCSLRQKLVEEIHTSPLSVHVGRDKTMDLLEDKYYWPKLCPNVARYVEWYHPSQKAKGVTQKASLYMPLLITNAP